MKTLIKIAISAFVISSCSKYEQPEINKITGIYSGSLVKSSTNNYSVPATVDISKAGDYRVNIRCYSDSLDTNFVMDIYQDNNKIYCSNNQSKTGNHMMGMNKYCNEDEHHGEFDLNNNFFRYFFSIISLNGNYKIEFTGTKQ